MERWNVGKLGRWKVESLKAGKYGSWKVRSKKVGKLEIGKVRSRKVESVCRFSSPRKSVSCRKAVLSPCKDRKM